MKRRFITVEREYGSGGTEIARKLAQQCNVACYGREILEEVSQKHGVSIERIEQYEENATSSFFYSLVAMSRAQTGRQDLLSTEGLVFLEEQNAIRRLAANGNAIFLGHCACEAFKGQEGIVRVFIRGNVEDRKRRIAQEYGIRAQKVEDVMRRFDKKRANYYYANTSRRWDDKNNYDIVLDSSTLGIDGCVAVLKPLLTFDEED